MQVETLVNGGISVILIPDNPMEEEMIKVLMKQQNHIIEFRTAVTVLSKTFRNGIIICKESTAVIPEIKKIDLPEE